MLIDTPIDDYELLDFGAGRKLERFGEVVVQRPDPLAEGPPAQTDWASHWVFDPRRGPAGQWVAGTLEVAPEAWEVTFGGRPIRLALGEGGQLGCRPDQLVCWRWLTERLAGWSGTEVPRVLNLFAGPGGTSAAAAALGAEVTHVAISQAALDAARRNSPEASGRVRWKLTDVPAFVAHALNCRETYDLILVDPPGFARLADGHVWDMQRDFSRLMRNLRRLASTACLGVRVTLHTRDVRPEAAARFLFEAFPGHRVEVAEVGLATAAGRVLPAAVSASWSAETAEGDARASAPLDAAGLEERLEVYLDAVLSSRRTAAEPARRLASLARPDQEFVLRWVENLVSSNAEMAYQVATHAAQALGLMERVAVEGWILRAMDVFDSAGLHPAIATLQEVEGYAQALAARAEGLAFEEVAGVLGHFAHGLAGRPLRLDCDELPYTDTETLFLPPLVACLPRREDNFSYYKVQLVLLWAQNRFGTFRTAQAGQLPVAIAAVRTYPDPERAARLLLALESLRLDACIGRALPGAHRQLHALLDQLGESLVPAGWEGYRERLAAPGAGVADSCALLAEVYAAGSVPAVSSLIGRLVPEQVETVMAQRLAREKDLFRTVLMELAHEADAAAAPPEPPAAGPATDRPAAKFTLEQVTDPDRPEVIAVQLALDGQPVAPPVEARALIDSILQDLGTLPEDYLVAAGPGGYRAAPSDEHTPDPNEVWKGTYHEEGAFLYNEWDFKRSHYRKNWCVLREQDVAPQPPGFVARTLRRYSGLIKELRRTFEALRGEDKLLKKQPQGDDIDIDALVEAYADVRSGLELTDRLFTKKYKHERNMAVMFMVDMSGSTKGWINDAEREALVLLCEALETLGDRYAIYGFSGNTRKKCELFRIKRFDEGYSEEVRGRITGITPQEYTRMGVTIRHLSRLLGEVEARTKLLITLSDGKPDDFDGYRGEYGIEDTRQALIEAKQQGIHPFCITIDETARDYLPHMYGAVNYTVIDNVAKLPLKVSDIYRRLTT